MPRARARCTQADMARAIRAAKGAGLPAWSVEITPTGSVFIHSEPRKAVNDDSPEPAKAERKKEIVF